MQPNPSHADAPAARHTRCLVKRRTSETDRRQVEVHLEEAGETLLARLAAMHRAELKSLTGTFLVPQIDL